MRFHDAKRPFSVGLPYRICSSIIRRSLACGLLVDVPYGDLPLKIRADLSTSMGLGLYRYRQLEPEVKFMLECLKKGDTFIDGGANIGLYTLAAAHQVGQDGSVHAFEPAGPTRDKLLKNISLNPILPVQVHPVALGAHQAELEFFIFEGNHSGISSFSPGEMVWTRKEKVPVRSLDEIHFEKPFKKVSLIKLDLEGAEMSALIGVKSVIAEFSPDFIIEIEDEHLKRQNSSAHEVLDFFRTSGYQGRRFQKSSNYWLSRAPHCPTTSYFE